MKQEYNRLFDKITSDRSDGQLIESVLRKAENMDKKAKFNKKAVIIPVAAALTLMIGTVGVGAANDWDYASILSSFFSEKAADNNSEWHDNFNFSKYGMPLDHTIIKDDCTIEILGIAADRSTAYMLCDITINKPEGEIYDGYINVGGTIPKVTNAGSESTLIKCDDNKLTVTMMYYIDDGEFPDDTFKFGLRSVYYYLAKDDGTTDESMRRYIDISETIEIDMGSFNRSHEANIIRPNKVYTIDEYEIALTELRISPFKLSFDLTADKETREAISDIGGYRQFMRNVNIKLSDGTEMKTKSGWLGSNYTGPSTKSELFFSYPINPDDVVSVTIAGITYDLS